MKGTVRFPLMGQRVASYKLRGTCSILQKESVSFALLSNEMPILSQSKFSSFLKTNMWDLSIPTIDCGRAVDSNMFIFTPIWGIVQFWLIFLRWVETTNQWINRVYHVFRCFPIPETVGKNIINLHDPLWTSGPWQDPIYLMRYASNEKKICFFKGYIGKLHYQLI